MKKTFILLLTFFSISLFSQKHNYKVGDTIYYKERILSTLKESNSFSIITATSLKKGNLTFLMNNFKKCKKDSTKYFLSSKYQTQVIGEIDSYGIRTFYHSNGSKSSQGNTKNNKPIDEWNFWYKNKKIRETKKFFFNRALNKIKQPKVLSFWNREGKQTIINGNGRYLYKTIDFILYDGFYKKGKKEKTWTVTKKGKLVYKEIYKRGNLISGMSIDNKGKEYNYTDLFLHPKYKSGKSAIYKHVKKHFKIPKIALKHKIDGRILTSFKITIEGNVSEVKNIQSVCIPCDVEAIRVIKLMKNWEPAIKRGQKAAIRYTIPISYKLN